MLAMRINRTFEHHWVSYRPLTCTPVVATVVLQISTFNFNNFLSTVTM